MLRENLRVFPSLQLSAKTDSINSAIEAVAKGGKENLQNAHQALFKIYNANYHAAITDVNEERAKLFKNNLSRLAAAKATHAVNDIHRQLADENGEVRDQEAYRIGAKKVTNMYNRFQAAEYNTSVHRCRVAKQWEQFTAEQDLYPNIEWLHTRSATPREVHLEYVGHIWPMDDPFWDENQPGCEWNCKCSVRNTDEPATDNEGVKIIPPSQGLEGNPFYTGEIITDNHPYFLDVPSHVPEVGVLENPDNIVYLNDKTPQGDVYQEHYNCLFEKETKANKAMIPYLFDNGFKKIKLLPQINAKEVALRERYYGAEFQATEKTKCPDAMADGQLIEFKEVSSSGKSFYRNLSDALNDAAHKSNIAVIKIKAKLSADTLKNIIAGKFKQYPNLDKIIIIRNGKSKSFNR